MFVVPGLRCGCDECVQSRSEDSLRHSRSRINAYRALASPSLIALSSKDPILTAFELSWELRRLSFLEHEFKVSEIGRWVASFTRDKSASVRPISLVSSHVNCFRLPERISRATATVSGLCHRIVGPYTDIERIRSNAKSRSNRTNIRARRANASEPIEVGNQAETEKGLSK